MSEATIRIAAASDARGIALTHIQSWREAYAGIISDERLAGFSLDERIARWTLNLADPSATTRVAELDGEIVGFITAGAPRDEPVRDLELRAIYLLRKASHRGIGTALVTAALTDAPAYVWVLEKNTSAQGFYRSLGFELDGESKVLPDWENLVDIRMVR